MLCGFLFIFKKWAAIQFCCIIRDVIFYQLFKYKWHLKYQRHSNLPFKNVGLPSWTILQCYNKKNADTIYSMLLYFVIIKYILLGVSKN